MLVDLTQPDILEHNHILFISLFINHSTVQHGIDRATDAVKINRE